ncbi:MAG: hypothetical protein WC487_02465 [Candidatus Omnitrophota bacterium]
MRPHDRSAVILIDHAGLELIGRMLPADIDKVAMTADAMLAFGEKGAPFRVFNDFFDIGDFRRGNTAMMREAGELLCLLDRQNAKALGYERAFSGNILYFVTFFTNLYYIHNVCRGLKRKYDRLYLAGSSCYDKVFDINMDMSLNGLAFHGFNIGLANKVSMLRHLLLLECYWRQAKTCRHVNWFYYLYKARRAVKKAVKHLFVSRLGSVKKYRNGRIYIMQDGYEIGYIKDRMPEYNYVNPLDGLKSAGYSFEAVAFGMDDSSTRAIREFCDKWFDGFNNDVNRLFDCYCRQVASHVTPFVNYARSCFNRHKPAALYFSAGACRISEDIFAYIANKRQIPVYYFQHGGTTMFYTHPYQDYVEQNPVIDKTNMYHSKAELDFFSSGGRRKSYAPGSDRLYNFYHARKSNRTRRKKKILYCSSPFNAYNYRDLMTNSTDSDLFQINSDVIDCVSGLGLAMSVKVHPSDEGFNYVYFRHMVKAKKAGGVGIVRGIPAEAIIDRYGLLILDYIGTALIPVSFALDMPVIIYLKDRSLLRGSFEKDLYARFHIVSCRQELESCLSSYREDRLGSKFSAGLMEKYAFRLDSGRPSDAIVEIIKRDIGISNKKGF